MEILKRIEEAVVKYSIEDVKTLTRTALEQNVPPSDILNQGLIKGLGTIGDLYERQQIFVPELLLAGMAMKEGLSLLKPTLEKRNIPPLGKMVIGTVQGDVHDIGKNIVSMFLLAPGST